uniref:hypothetical protein n=1 Tax=Rhizobium ruizarguesonis TaxID=2081791 RepID=UPI001A8EE587
TVRLHALSDPQLLFSSFPPPRRTNNSATIGSKLSMHGKLRPVSPEYPRAADLSSKRNLT